MKTRGRPRSSNRLRREDCAALEIRTLPMLPPPRSPVTDTAIVVDGSIEGYRRFRIQLNVSRTAQGWRCLCPRCNRRSAVIYFPPYSNEPACRICLRLVYECQYNAYMPMAAAMLRYSIERIRSGQPLW